VFYNEFNYIGDTDLFMEWALNEFRYVDNQKHIIYIKKKNDALKKAFTGNPTRQYVYLDLSVGGGTPEKLVIELFIDICPRTCENFR